MSEEIGLRTPDRPYPDGGGGLEGGLVLERIGVVGRRLTDRLPPVLQRLERFAADHGVELRYSQDTLEDAPQGARPLDLDQEGLSLMLALGGDGTLLRASRMVCGRGVPVLGVNLGRLGFLTAAGEEALESSLERIAAGDFVLDRRFTLRASITSESGEGTGAIFHALNDFVFHNAGVARLTRLDLTIGLGDYVDEIGSFSADGVIISTPTGSTAYSMSAGGPIIVPSVDCIALTAICPHTLAVRPLVVPAEARIRIRAVDRPEDLVLTVDGQQAETLGEDDWVVVQRGELEIPLVRFPGQSFFATMRRKLNWAIRTAGRE